MKGVRHSCAEPKILALGDSLIAAEVDLSIYSLPSVFRACYKFTNICYLFIARTEEPDWLAVTFQAKETTQHVAALLGEFFNELLDQQIREALEIEAGPVRELIVAQAFAEGNLLDVMRDEGNYQEDPLGIGKRR